MDSAESREAHNVASSLAGLYAVERVIAQGGMADVYLATDLRHQRKVAIKVMRRETMGVQDRQRFMREINIAANLSHPNIVPLFDSGQAGAMMYYVMPLVNGPSLREALASRGRLPLDEALAITFEVADALAFAHQRGVVHRDIKPGNILLEAGHARVADFGVAKAMEHSGHDALTSGQFAVGTLAYMSPEQAASPLKTDGRSDIYSLAVVLYEMLTGELPFDGATPDAALASKVIGEFPSARNTAGIPTYVDAAIRHALVPNPDDRFATIDEFVAALRGEAPKGTRRFASTGWWTRRRRRIAGLTALIVWIAALAVIAKIGRDDARASTPAPKLGRIVVVPFTNDTHDSTLDPVSREVGDWLTEGLFNTHILEVVPPLNVLGVGKTPLSTRRVAEETDAGTVVEGSFEIVGDSLWFRLRVSDEGGRRVAGEITDVRAARGNLQPGIRELRSRLMGWLALRYDDRLQRSATNDLQPPRYEAYRVFDEGMTLYNASQYDRASKTLLHAYDLDSTFTRALLYASIAMTNAERWSAADSLLELVRQRRDALDPYHRALLDARIGFVRGNTGMLMTAIRQAAQIAPKSKAVYNLAVAAFQNGYVQEALGAIETLQPDQDAMKGYTGYWSIYGSIVHASGDYERELGLGIEARKEFPDQLIAFVPQVRALAAKGSIDELSSTLAEARRLPAGPYYWDMGRVLEEVASELYVHGHPQEARTYWHELNDWLFVRDTLDRIGWRRVQALYELQRWDEAEVRLQTLRRNDPTKVAYFGMMGMLDARRGNRAAALAIADSLANWRAAYEFGIPQTYRARIEALLGNRDIAVSALRQSFVEGGPYQAWIHKDVDLYALRNYPPFRALLAERK